MSASLPETVQQEHGQTVSSIDGKQRGLLLAAYFRSYILSLQHMLINLIRPRHSPSSRIVSIELMTGDNLNFVHLTWVAHGLDGTTGDGSYTWTCPTVDPAAPIYFYRECSPTFGPVPSNGLRSSCYGTIIPCCSWAVGKTRCFTVVNRKTRHVTDFGDFLNLYPEFTNPGQDATYTTRFTIANADGSTVSGLMCHTNMIASHYRRVGLGKGADEPLPVC